ncbi:LPXTG cell wall anchor domain-containing protein, partial [Gemella parahaemolysans]
FPDGTKATIPGSKAVEEAPKGVKAPEKTPVKDPSNLTDAEKEAAKAKIKGANADVVEVIFDKAGNATVITKDGKVYTIVAKDIFKQKEVPTLPGKVGVENVAKLTDAEKEAVKQALIAANPKLKDAKITIADNGEATIVYPDGQVVVIPANNLVTAKGSNGQGTNAKLGQRLANTGTTETNTGLAGLGLGILGGLLAAARRRKEK